MLTIELPEIEIFDEDTNEFLVFKPQTLKLEHSLVSISKWESKWLKPFLTKEQKTAEETIDYIRFMNITQHVDPRVFRYLPKEALQAVEEYITNPHTATKINRESLPRKKGPQSQDTMTSELIYTSMVMYNIPFECQKWHLNRLMALIELLAIKNSPQKKKTRRQILEENAALNAARKKQLGTTG